MMCARCQREAARGRATGAICQACQDAGMTQTAQEHEAAVVKKAQRKRLDRVDLDDRMARIKRGRKA